MRKLAELALEEEGYKVYTASDGEEGLKVAEDISPALILVDFIMPRMSGYEFCKSARESSRLKDVPIILDYRKGRGRGQEVHREIRHCRLFHQAFQVRDAHGKSERHDPDKRRPS
ncbi:MAG: response regulator [Desulfobacterales bacterium]|nr:response regulator [Desulfobacterales bacterium]